MSQASAAAPSGHPSPSLPDRAVTPATIEDAYVRFIFYCNPALPRSADTQSLREAFRNPPRSGGKLFSPYVIFELVRKFYAKEIKTWTELTTRLGVQPPDPGKDESTQKIAQYGVRLKKWMNSMHIKAFFEYLMEIPNDYWTRIPDDPDPIALSVRDGIAVEDDMALRALLPHIRPKRGRKRPDEEPPMSLLQSSQRVRLPLADVEDPSSQWPTQSHIQTSPMALDGVLPGASGPESQTDDSIQALANQWPSPAASAQPVPTTNRTLFWDEALESPQPSTTPAKPKASNLRRGAKNVSSAWKTAGLDAGSSKTRGRPPIYPRPGDEVAGPSLSLWAPRSDFDQAAEMSQISDGDSLTGIGAPARLFGSGTTYPSLMPPPPVPFSSSPMGPISTNEAESSAGPSAGPHATGHIHQEPAIKGLQQPSPRPAIPHQGDPPVPSLPPGLPASDRPRSRRTDAPHVPTTTVSEGDAPTRPSESPLLNEPLLPGREVPPWYFENLEDRTNVDTLMSFFVFVLQDAEWVDPQGNKQEPAGIEESTAMVNVTLEQMFKTADGTQSFLINLSALAGARMLMSTRPRCYRDEVSDDSITYYFNWKYCFGPFKGHFTITNRVPLSMWKKRPGEETDDVAASGSMEAPATETRLSQAQWQAKYQSLVHELQKRDHHIMKLRNRVMGAL